MQPNKADLDLIAEAVNRDPEFYRDLVLSGRTLDATALISVECGKAEVLP